MTRRNLCSGVLHGIRYVGDPRLEGGKGTHLDGCALPAEDGSFALGDKVIPPLGSHLSTEDLCLTLHELSEGKGRARSGQLEERSRELKLERAGRKRRTDLDGDGFGLVELEAVFMAWRDAVGDLVGHPAGVEDG